MRLVSEIESCLAEESNLRPGDRIVVAFSGGPDSTSLLWGLSRIAPVRGWQVHAVHIDHAIDSDSRRRAVEAERICRHLAIPLRTVRLESLQDRAPGESLEAAARRSRYRQLEIERRRLCARFVLTAHHAEDQIETLLLRLAFGTGIEGLEGIQGRNGTLVRPLLRLRRHQIDEALERIDVEPVQDPSNRDFRQARSRMRHATWPYLLAQNPGLDRRLLALAQAAAGARRRIERQIAREVEITHTDGGLEVDLAALTRRPRGLWRHVLAHLNRAAGRSYPPPAAACAELERQLTRGGKVGCDCGGGWCWEVSGSRLALYPKLPEEPAFAYTVEAPGACRIDEVSQRFSIRPGKVEDWMFQPSRWRVGLVLPIAAGDRVVVRSRRPGDRVRPFGCSHTRRLKDVLIDRHVPRRRRSQLPLLEVGGRIVWVPGVTIDDRCRVETGQQVWIAQLESR